jgi:hypothetical protein
MNDDPEDQRIQGHSSEDVPASPPALGTQESRPGLPPDAPPRSPDLRIQGGSIRLFRVAGIDVLLHWSWVFFAVLRLQSTGSDDSFGFAHYESQLWYAVEYLALFGIVLLHEFGHVLACRSVGGIANRIVLMSRGHYSFGQVETDRRSEDARSGTASGCYRLLETPDRAACGYRASD